MKKHLSGFVNIIGRPNVGKSTLLNALVGERMSIITNKPQTTRHRIIGIVSDEDYQVVFSDTPGIISKPNYRMQEAMNRFVHSTFEDADVMLLLTEVGEVYADDDLLIQRLKMLPIPVLLAINKTDLVSEEDLQKAIDTWRARMEFKEIIPISALQKKNTEQLFQHILANLPEGPAYYPKDQLTDRPERFFVSEIIREKILLHYKQEIPYSSEVVVFSFKEDPIKSLIRIYAIIYVSRESQKAIILGKGGLQIKQLGIDARKDLEVFLEKQVFLDLQVKVLEDWRNNERILRQLGYTD